VRYRRRKVDANQAEIVAALRQIGCSVLDLSAVGGGCPDLLVGRLGASGRGNLLVEIKSPKRQKPGTRSDAAKTLERQEQFRAEWNGPVTVVETVQQAIAAALSI